MTVVNKKYNIVLKVFYLGEKMKKLFSIVALSLILACANNMVFAGEDCNCKKTQDCKCEKVCDCKDCKCKKACDCKDCKCENCECKKACDCKDCKCENCDCKNKQCKKKASKKFNFFKSKKIKCNCDK